MVNDLFLLSDRQMARIEQYFPLARGIPRVDDQRVISGIVYVIKHGLQWKDARNDYGPHKTLYNRFIRWSRLGVFDRIFAALAAEGQKPERIMIDTTHLKAHRTAASLLKKGMFTPYRANQGRTELQAPRCLRCRRQADHPALVRGADERSQGRSAHPQGPSICHLPHRRPLYRQRHKVENTFAKLKDWRRIATRYDRCAHTFFSAICIAATMIFWL